MASVGGHAPDIVLWCTNGKPSAIVAERQGVAKLVIVGFTREGGTNLAPRVGPGGIVKDRDLTWTDATGGAWCTESEAIPRGAKRHGGSRSIRGCSPREGSSDLDPGA